MYFFLFLWYNKKKYGLPKISGSPLDTPTHPMAARKEGCMHSSFP